MLKGTLLSSCSCRITQYPGTTPSCPRNVGIKLNDKDINRARELLKYRWFQKKEWEDEIKQMPSTIIRG